MTAARQLLRYLVPYRRMLALLVVVATSVLGMESLGLGVLLLLLTSSTLPGIELPWLADRFDLLPGWSTATRIYVTAGLLVAVTLLRSTLQYTEQLLSLRLRRQVESSLQKKLFARFHALSLEMLQRERRGAWIALFGQYTRGIGALALQLGQAISSMVIFVAYVAVAFLISWPLTLFCLLFLLPIGFFLRPLIGMRLQRASKATRALMRATQGLAQERLRAMKIIRLFGQESWSLESYGERLDNFLAQEYQTASLAALTRPLSIFLNVCMIAGLLVAGLTFLPGPPEAILWQLALFLTIALRLAGPVNNLTTFQVKMTEAAPILQEVEQMLSASYPLAPPSGLQSFPGLRHGIELREVSFAYSPQEPLILHNLNLYIPHRQVTALVGASGEGKSTLVNLLARLYDPTQGTIWVDGVDLRDFDLTTWRHKVAVVSQEVVLFHASVWDNLRFARADATEEEIVQATKAARAHHFICKLPHGYDTLLQGGQRLSGGQRQRIALARALLMQADVLILDEATSELDAVTEQAIRRTIYERAHAQTLFVIAHRLSNLLCADTIYLLAGGSIVEQGTHDQLLQKSQLYRQMAQAQHLQ